MLNKKIRIFLVLIGFLSISRSGWADKNYYGFDEKIEYDIYFYNGENTTAVLENISILGFQQIGGKEFLVIKSRGFKLSDESGYLLFDSIIAILPDRNFKVGKTDSIQMKQYQ